MGTFVGGSPNAAFGPTPAPERAPALPIVAGVPVPADPAVSAEWSAAFDRALKERVALGPLSKTRAGDKWRVASLSVSAGSENGPYRVAVEGFGAPLSDPDAVSCSCPGGRKSQRCKHAAALLAVLGLI